MIKVFQDAEGLSRYAADLFADWANEAVKVSGRFVAALSGGKSPDRTYELLASEPYQGAVPWGSIHVFWGDERCVPLEDPESNAGNALRTWLNRVPVPESHIHPINGRIAPERAAEEYEGEIRRIFGVKPPVFDLVFLGLGKNGHTASLFPGTPVLKETKRMVSEVYVADQNMHRVTLTAPVINRARKVVFLVYGGSKAAVVGEVLEGGYEPQRFPAQLIRPSAGETYWLLDEAAASKIKESKYETVR